MEFIHLVMNFLVTVLGEWKREDERLSRQPDGWWSCPVQCNYWSRGFGVHLIQGHHRTSKWHQLVDGEKHRLVQGWWCWGLTLGVVQLHRLDAVTQRVRKG